MKPPNHMTFREAKTSDIEQIQIIRRAVKENVLSNPKLISDRDCNDFITKRGKGWICEIDNRIVGFSIVDMQENNIWALFVHPDFEKRGIGRQLHDLMMNWYFNQTKADVWLGTDPNTRAESFYRKSSWKEIGAHGDGEIKFVMSYKNWKNRKRE